MLKAQTQVGYCDFKKKKKKKAKFEMLHIFFPDFISGDARLFCLFLLQIRSLSLIFKEIMKSLFVRC